MKIHQKYMMRCIELAKNGLGTTYPNPLVGCVIVHEQKILGEGWHYQAGKPHAEVNALRSVTEAPLLKNATLYVSLEPCCHFGKTPPCADLIIEKGIKKVVVGSLDPNPQVAGKGIQKLKEAGCEVTVGVLHEACDGLNKRFFTFHQKKRPYVFLKWAETQDGFIAPKERKEPKPVWITNRFSRQRVHQMRAQEQAILVGTQTILMDNPTLTTRDWEGNSPLRVVLDRTLRIPKTATIFDGTVPTLIISEKQGEATANVCYETIDFSEGMAFQVLKKLYERNIQSLLVEGGAQTLQSFIEENLWDEAIVFKGPASFSEGIKAPRMHGTPIRKETLQKDQLLHYKNPAS